MELSLPHEQASHSPYRVELCCFCASCFRRVRSSTQFRRSRPFFAWRRLRRTCNLCPRRLLLVSFFFSRLHGLFGPFAPLFSHSTLLPQPLHTHRTLRSLFFFNDLWHKFEVIDTSGDRRLDLGEFVRGAALIDLHFAEDEARAVFDEIDENGGGVILFNEFCAYVCRMKAEELDQAQV